MLTQFPTKPYEARFINHYNFRLIREVEKLFEHEIVAKNAAGSQEVQSFIIEPVVLAMQKSRRPVKRVSIKLSFGVYEGTLMLKGRLRDLKPVSGKNEVILYYGPARSFEPVTTGNLIAKALKQFNLNLLLEKTVL
ncbi:hypothetical protein [Adhaeribacter soli]|uniref:Uncharacterized protein n=1 Tax=Adhaeribacter soli TaxID=2607655 RepID=A0A5N1J709_9BACT|nr:hypothetical protein [Adhaeribacter soli]KAA9345752.1 hypothetical protein F0P94_01310 [Adhaeribacter soli]